MGKYLFELNRKDEREREEFGRKKKKLEKRK